MVLIRCLLYAFIQEFIHTQHRNTTVGLEATRGIAMLRVDKFPYPHSKQGVTNKSMAVHMHLGV